MIRVRSSAWKVLGLEQRAGGHVVSCRGTAGIVKGKSARFVLELEPDYAVLDPARVTLVPDTSAGLTDTKLFLEAAFRSTPTTARQPLTLGKAAIDDLAFQHVPVEMALTQDRVRLLIADDVGLGKTLEAGLITSELILRGRANRILVVTTRSMLAQFQKEFWTRFSIPLSRLDSAAIHRMRNQVPAHYNVFDQFDRSIVSIDTLKQDSQLLDAIPTDSQVGLRDRALIGVMIYAFARVSAALGMTVEDYYPQSRRMWLRLHEKGGKHHDMPCHHALEELLDAYVAEVGLLADPKGPLFRTAARGVKGRPLSDEPIPRETAWAMIRRRARQAGIKTAIGNHTFRATGITAYLEGGGQLETARAMAAHASTKTTQLYDRRTDQVTLAEIERIRL